MSDRDETPETPAGAPRLPAAALLPAQVYRATPGAPRDASGQLIASQGYDKNVIPREVTPRDVALLVVESTINALRQGRSGHSVTPVDDETIRAALWAGLCALTAADASSPMLASERDAVGRDSLSRGFELASMVVGEERARYLAEGVATASRRRYEAERRAARGR